MGKNRILGAALVVALPFLSVHAQAQAGGDRDAYNAAMRCYVLTGSAAGDQKKAGNAAKADLYKDKAHTAFDLAVKFGRSLGLSGQQIETDINAMQDGELRRLLTDAEYSRQSAATCRALGLL